jgi:hypothetical protein
MLLRIDSLLRRDPENSCRRYVTPAADTYAVTSANNSKGVASGVCGSAPSLCDSTALVRFYSVE